MKDKVYLDTNILVYLYSDESKSIIVEKLIDDYFELIVLSTQVLNELFNVLSIKLKVKSKEEAKETIQSLITSFEIAIISPDIIISAIDLAIKYQYRFFDSLMIAAALSSGCTILFSEDLQDGQRIENQLTIKNPFKI